MKLPKWLYCLLIALVCAITTSCSDTEDEPVYPVLSETAWELKAYVETDPDGKLYSDTDPDPELLVFHKNGNAELWTCEVDFEYPISYRYTTNQNKLTIILSDYFDNPEEDDVDPAEDDDNMIDAEWNILGNIGEKEMHIKSKDSEGYTRIFVYRMKPYVEVDLWVDIHKREWNQHEK